MRESTKMLLLTVVFMLLVIGVIIVRVLYL